MIDQYARTELLIGEDGLKRLKDSSVMVFGVGGVGSHCIEALARSGVGRLILVDNDAVSVTNINRQSIAYHSTIGQMKTKVMRERIRDIDPAITVRTYETFVLPDNLADLLDQAEKNTNGKIDYIIDAIDTVSAKIALVEESLKRCVPLISSMGTGNKLHPELFEIADLADTSVCPLCRVMRRELKQRGIMHLKVLYSKEKPVDTCGRSTGEDSGARRSLPGSISFVPPVAGLLIAGEVIRELAGINTGSRKP
jgi:tRNA A37 threonylcarbamoyladenosine dehydratase